MSKPYTTKGLLLTPKTANVQLEVDIDCYPRGIHVTGNMGTHTVDFRMTPKECRHFADFFTMQARRLERMK